MTVLHKCLLVISKSKKGRIVFYRSTILAEMKKIETENEKTPIKATDSVRFKDGIVPQTFIKKCSLQMLWLSPHVLYWFPT